MAANDTKQHDDEKGCQRIKDDVAKAITQSQEILGTSNLPADAKALAQALNNLLTGTQKYMVDCRFQPKDEHCLPDSK